MAMTFLVGGARSGKSSLAVELATRASMTPSTRDARRVHAVVTAEPGDDEMRDRIARHQAARPPSWTTIEAPRALGDVTGNAGVDSQDIVIVDCLSFWVANRLMDGDSAEAIEAEAAEVASWASQRIGTTIAVSNEVGAGVVPDNALARQFRDTLGRVNAIWSDAAERALLVVAGRVVVLTRACDALDELGAMR